MSPPQSPFEGARLPHQGRGGVKSLRGMGSGILLVMYYTPRTLGKGVCGWAGGVGVQLGPVPT